ncbi:TetR/AcrR family transcriptional regulator [Tundrisphaera sp. TA3]|uniref:TetR/AcrR family transcriptional regulator n=1 Tax=Tundrisphaera sp. TA3 TaxID=3435775 RepID=UPI003EBBBAC0
MVKDARMGEAEGPVRASGDAAGQILKVAARLFAAHGYDATSVREIVEAAGITKPTLYYYFGSKQGLAEELLRRPHVELVADVRALLARETNPTRLLRDVLERHLQFCRDEPDWARFFFSIFSSPQNVDLAESMCDSKHEMKQVMGDCFARLAELGLVDPGRIEGLGRMFRGLIFVSILEFLRYGKPLEPGLADDLTRDLLQGFARPGTLNGHLETRERS